MGLHIDYRFCPQCRGPFKIVEGHPHCPACSITIYQNVAGGAAVLPVRNGQVLLIRRGQEPLKGAYDVVGGFIEPGETPQQAAIREAKEETGLDVKIMSLLGVYSDRYGDGVYTLGIHYVAEVIGGTQKAGDDAASIGWYDIQNLPAEALTQGFKNVQDSLRDLQARHG